MKISNSDLIKFITEEVREAVGLDYSNDSRKKYQTGKFGAPVVENEPSENSPFVGGPAAELIEKLQNLLTHAYDRGYDEGEKDGRSGKNIGKNQYWALETLDDSVVELLRQFTDVSGLREGVLSEEDDLKIEFVLKTLLQALPPENRKDRRVQDVLRDAAEKLVQVILVEGEEETQGGKITNIPGDLQRKFTYAVEYPYETQYGIDDTEHFIGRLSKDWPQDSDMDPPYLVTGYLPDDLSVERKREHQYATRLEKGWYVIESGPLTGPKPILGPFSDHSQAFSAGKKQYEQNSSVDGLKEQIRQFVREEIEEKGNPWAICTSQVGREDKAKYESCVQKVKKKTGYKK